MSAMLPQENSAPQDDDPLSSRPLVVGWVVLGIWWFMLALVVFSMVADLRPDNNDPFALFLLGVIFVVPCVLGTWAMLRYKIRADKKGITFVGLIGERLIPWQHVSDFWLKLPPGNEATTRMPYLSAYIEADGKAYSLLRGISSLPALRTRIEREAKWAKVRQFDFKETREDSPWPKTFGYKAISRWRVAGKFVLSFLITEAMLVALMGAGNSKWQNFIPTFAAFWASLTFASKVGVFLQAGVFALAASLRFLIPLAEIWTLRKRLTQSIEATKTGLLFRDGEREEFVGYEEIESYSFEAQRGFLQPSLCILETRRQRFEFLKSIGDSKILLYLIQDRATQASTKKWRFVAGRDNETLGNIQQLWGGGGVGLGPKIYHYRTRSNRILLAFGLGLNALFWGSSLYQYLRYSVPLGRPGDWLGDVFVVALFVCPCIWGLLVWFYSALESDENGLRQRGIWGQRFMKWSELESYSFNNNFYMLQGKGKTMIFGSVANFDTLRTEIEQRAPQAKGSWTGPVRGAER